MNKTSSPLLFPLIGILLATTAIWQSPASATIPRVGVYNAGSRYITIARKGNRYCYQGISIPPRRYAVAVGETIGSLSPFGGGLVIDGWRSGRRRPVTIILSQSGTSLLVKFDREPSGQSYDFFESLPSSFTSDELNKCLNSRGVFFKPVPGSGYRIR
jgi:hypothetical protein